MFVTEHTFELPKGYADEQGDLHKQGVMRLATAADEIIPLHDPRVEKNPAYLLLIILSRVVTRLGTVKQITPNTIEGLFVEDLAYLQALYNRINAVDGVVKTCPHCQKKYKEDAQLGELAATP